MHAIVYTPCRSLVSALFALCRAKSGNGQGRAQALGQPLEGGQAVSLPPSGGSISYVQDVDAPLGPLRHLVQGCAAPAVPTPAGGDISFVQDVESTLEAIYGAPVRVPPELLARKQPLPHRTFLTRMLNNLKQAGPGGWECFLFVCVLCACPGVKVTAMGSALALPFPASLLCESSTHACHTARCQPLLEPSTAPLSLFQPPVPPSAHAHDPCSPLPTPLPPLPKSVRAAAVLHLRPPHLAPPALTQTLPPLP